LTLVNRRAWGAFFWRGPEQASPTLIQIIASRPVPRLRFPVQEREAPTMSKTRSKHPTPKDGKGKLMHKATKYGKSGHDIRDALSAEPERLYREDFLPPKAWHNDT
jgi:hypothetical protein